MVKVGPSFSDFVSWAEPSRVKRRKGSRIENVRVLIPFYILLLVFIVLVLKLFYIQVVRWDYYKVLSDGNRLRSKIIHAQRGIIFDRNHIPLVQNVPIFKEIKNGKTTYISQDQAVGLLAQNDPNLETDVEREYVYKDVFSHVLGYIGEISKDELMEPSFHMYNSGDFVGKMGIEQTYESLLRGQDGKELYEVDSQGNTIRSLGREEPTSGKDITTTLDTGIQKAAYDAMNAVNKGAVVVSDPNTGGILALVSKPSFDPNLFTHTDSYKTSSSYHSIQAILSDTKNEPLLNRVISGVYPPGSTFKLITAASALENGAIQPDTKIDDTGILTVNNFSYTNWYYTQYGRTEGLINVVDAIKRSNDIFFYKTAQFDGVNRLAATARQFDLGEKLGIDIAGEEAGLVPDPTWKKKQIGEEWYLGDTFHLGIGQGYLLTTPLQVNFWTSVFANGGTLYKPHVLAESAKVLKSKLVPDKYLTLIREGMRESCDPGGVVYPLFDFRINNSRIPIDNLNFIREATASAQFAHVTMGCKSGTAETYGTEKPHAWVTVFAPFYNPQIVVTVLVENGGEGSDVAAPIAKKILEAYFNEIYR